MTPLHVGKLRIDVLPEIAHQMMPVDFLFNDLTPEDMARNADWLGPRFLDPVGWQLGMAFQAYVVRTETLTILVDSCNGNHKQRLTAPWQHDFRASTFMENLAGLGLRPEDIDIVLCTHLHCDHVGWNTRLENGRWVPTFPNARHVFNRTEYRHYEALFAKNPMINHGAFADSVLPVVEAGQADFVGETHHVLKGSASEIALRPSPGHSPGHACIELRDGETKAVICGDALHHPIQCDMPDLMMRADADPSLAIDTRRRLLTEAASSGSFLLVGHVPDWSIATISQKGSVFRMHNFA